MTGQDSKAKHTTGDVCFGLAHYTGDSVHERPFRPVFRYEPRFEFGGAGRSAASFSPALAGVGEKEDSKDRSVPETAQGVSPDGEAPGISTAGCGFESHHSEHFADRMPAVRTAKMVDVGSAEVGDSHAPSASQSCAGGSTLRAHDPADKSVEYPAQQHRGTTIIDLDRIAQRCLAANRVIARMDEREKGNL